MRICMLMAGDEVGGLEDHFITLCKLLAPNHDLHVIAHPVYRERLADISFHPLDMTCGRNNPLLLLRALTLLRRLSPNIIHAHANKATVIVARLKLLLPRTTRLVATLHSQKRNVRAFRKMDLVIGVSERVLQSLKGTNTVVVYPGIATPEPTHNRSSLRAALNIPEQQQIIIAAGRLVPVKRLDVLIDAMHKVPEALLLIAGSGTLRQELEQQAKRCAPLQIRMLGHCDNIPDLLAAADLCVISSDREGFSNVMAESLLVRTPVVATDVADMHILLPEGFIVECGNSDALGEAMATALLNPEQTRRLFAPSFEWARRELTPGRMLEETSKLYRELTES